MINVKYDVCGRSYYFLCTGHSGSAPRGQDIICAGVSSLVRALIAFLQSAHGRGLIYDLRLSVDEDGGEVAAEWTSTDDFTDTVTSEVAEAIFAGIRMISDAAPEYVRICGAEPVEPDE